MAAQPLAQNLRHFSCKWEQEALLAGLGLWLPSEQLATRKHWQLQDFERL